MKILIHFLIALVACGSLSCVAATGSQISPSNQFVQAPLVGNPYQGLYTTHATADFNRDGKPDLLVVNWSGPTYTLAVLLGNNKNQYVSKTVAGSTSNALGDPQVADMNGDGILDILTSSQGAWDDTGAFASEGEIDIYFGKGDGTFPSHKRVAVGQFMTPFIAAGEHC